MSKEHIAGLRHELLDRAHTLATMFDILLCEPVNGGEDGDGSHAESVPWGVRIEIEAISTRLHRLYQGIGALEDEA